VATRVQIKLDYKGIGEMLKVDMRETVDELADQVAARVDARGEPVEVRKYTTDRAAASVTIASVAGLAIQAKHGALTQAAASVGLEVRSK